MPEDARFRANLGTALFEARQLDDALAAFRAAQRLDPREPQYAMGAANCLALLGRLAEAETALREVTARFPGFALAWFNLGTALRDQERFGDAVPAFEQAVALDPGSADAHNSLGGCLHRLERFPEAEAAYREALRIAPDSAMALTNLASVLIDCGRFAEAEQHARELVAREPDAPMALSTLGAAIGHQGRLREALQYHRRAADIAPGDKRSLTALGSALHELGESAEAAQVLARAAAIPPDDPQTWFALSTALLALGDYAAGWRAYRHRPGRLRYIQRHPEVRLADALPADPAAQRIALEWEQGLGDQVFFLRYAPLLKARGATVAYRGRSQLNAMIARNPAFDSVIAETDPLPDADCTLLVGDLPAALIACGDAGVPPPLALAPLPDRAAEIRARLAAAGPPPYIALTWRGGVPPAEQRGGNWTLFKHAPLEEFARAVRGAGGTLVAVQRKPEPGEIARFAEAAGRPVHDFTNLNDDLEGMLALMALVDDYVGVSNTNTHLRAGTGRAARVLIPVPSEWRWMLSGQASPWFPGFRLYRQQTDGRWNDALSALAGDLSAAWPASA